MRELLDDKQTYKSCRTDPTQKLLRKNNKLIMEFYKQSYISKYEKFQLTSNSATAPRLYGLPKIHKQNMPLRPIASSFEVPCYNLAKYIGTILKNIILEIYNIKNSLELNVKLDNIYLDEDDILISLDVVSLFTNIPIHLAIKNIMTKWESLQNHTKIPKSQFLKALQFCLNDNNYFIFVDNIYNQTYGMPMGNPLSPTIADIILDTLLESCLTELDQQNIHIKMITKYVDDLFAIIKKKDEHKILETFNNYHKQIQFTLEKEENQFRSADVTLVGHSLLCDTYIQSTTTKRVFGVLSSRHSWCSPILSSSQFYSWSSRQEKINQQQRRSLHTTK
ncbi:uncharacterized protein LOC142235489 [Haematobia irritans]|uniref:uncharacterized protein LOC142235489 n=1 Tax=Haematobia irritans TaxID=7368 RepID=UPI003F502D4E